MDRTNMRGLASLSLERRREIAQLGGRASQASGRGHRYDSELAREAGAKGGKANAAKYDMRELGRRGGLASGRAKAARRAVR